jgi:Protein of unknown function (DUF4435)
MRESMTADREANAIELRRSQFSGLFLVVEGSTDKRFYANLICDQFCQIVETKASDSRKKRAIEILKILEKRNFPGILAIVDADFDRLDAIVYPSPNLFLTDTHDSETMMLRSTALDRLLAEYGSEEKISVLSQDVRTILLTVGLSIGYLRWISKKDSLNLNFKDIKFVKVIDDKKALGMNQDKLIEILCQRTENCCIKREDLKNRLLKEQNLQQDPWQLCSGHDLVEILSIGLRHIFGSMGQELVKSADLEKNLRLTHRPEDFLDTELYEKLKQWEIQYKLTHSILHSSISNDRL